MRAARERLDRKLAEEEAWLRRGVKARRTRNEGRVKALYALRAERAAQRAAVGDVRLGLDASRTSGKLVFDADHVSKSFAGVPVVADYTQRIMRGDRIGLIGANGSGKTTLLKLLVGELTPDRGTVTQGAQGRDRLLRSAARAARSRSLGRRQRQRRQRHGHRQRPAAAYRRLPRGLPLPARARCHRRYGRSREASATA